jgi:hypothetical protein
MAETSPKIDKLGLIPVFMDIGEFDLNLNCK